MGHLAPEDAAMQQAAADAKSALAEAIRSIGVISLAATDAAQVGRAGCLTLAHPVASLEPLLVASLSACNTLGP